MGEHNDCAVTCECGALIPAGEGVVVKTSRNISGRAWRCADCSAREIAELRAFNGSRQAVTDR